MANVEVVVEGGKRKLALIISGFKEQYRASCTRHKGCTRFYNEIHQFIKSTILPERILDFLFIRF